MVVFMNIDTHTSSAQEEQHIWAGQIEFAELSLTFGSPTKTGKITPVWKFLFGKGRGIR